MFFTRSVENSSSFKVQMYKMDLWNKWRLQLVIFKRNLWICHCTFMENRSAFIMALLE